jgi:non-specific serine/threonine protein kinase
MLLVDEHSETATRYDALETLRQYARDRLAEAGDLDRRRRLHATHFAVVAEEIGDAVLGPDELRGRRRLEQEIDNLRAAVGWALDRDDDLTFAIRIVASLAHTTNTGFPDVGLWATRALDGLDQATPAQRSAVLSSAGWRALNAGDVALAEARARDALRDGVAAEWRSPAIAYVLLAFTRVYAGDADGAVATLREAQRLLDSSSVPRSADQAMVAIALPAMLSLLGEDDVAQMLSFDALRIAREVGYPTAISTATFTVAVGLWGSDPERSARLIDESIAMVRAGAFPVVFGYALAMYAQLRGRAGDRIGALDAVREAIATSHDKGHLPMLSIAFDRGSQTLVDLGEYALAAWCAGIALGGPLRVVANLPVGHLGERESALACARDALGPPAYDDAYAEGGALTVDEAVRVVLAELDELRAG